MKSNCAECHRLSGYSRIKYISGQQKRTEKTNSKTKFIIATKAFHSNKTKLKQCSNF